MKFSGSAKVGFTKTIRPMNRIFEDLPADMRAHIDIEDEVAIRFSLEKGGVVQEIYSHPLMPGPERVAAKCGELAKEYLINHFDPHFGGAVGEALTRMLAEYFVNYGIKPEGERPEC